MVGAAHKYFGLKYGYHNGWIATLGRTPEQKFDAKTGKEDFTEQRQIGSYFETWRPLQEWSAQPICLHFEARGRKLVKADRIFHNAVGPILSANAVEKMRPWLEQDGYILPLEVMNSDEKFYLWWVPWIEDSVDLGRSEKFANGETVKKYALNDQKVNGLIAFRPHYTGMHNPDSQGQVLVNGEFSKAWIAKGLTGIEFKPT